MNSTASRECPGELFKYLPETRLDVLERRLIRFTPPSVLNDPFELPLKFSALASPEERTEAIRELLPQSLRAALAEVFPGVPAEALPPEVLASLEETLSSILPNQIAAFEHAVKRQVADVLRAGFNEQLGILSLAADPTNRLMWSHYASACKGYVLGFDATHSWFWQGRSPSDECRHLRKVRYVDKLPITVMTATTAVDAFLTKATDWEYEHEWRIIRPLSEAGSTERKADDVVHLFEYPPSALKSVIVGCRAAARLVDSIRQCLADTALAHVTLFTAQQTADEYGFDLVAADR